MSDPSVQPTSANTVKRQSAAPDAAPTASRGVLRHALRRVLPPLAVFGALATVGVWGHHTQWKVPKFSELTGAARPAADEWCEAHGVFGSQCVECNPDQFPAPPDYGWCEAHGIHQCPFDHPDVAQLQSESPISREDLERSERALELLPRAENNLACTFYRRRIQFVSHQAVLKAGVDVEPVMRAPMVDVIEAAGEIRYDPTRVAHVSTRATGTIWRVDKRVGDRVEQGEILALVDAAEVGRLKSELLTALTEERLQQANVQRLRELAGQGITAGRQRLEAESALRQARTRVLAAQQSLSNLGLTIDPEALRGMSEEKIGQQIRFAGLPTWLASQLEPATTSSNLLAVTSPLSGVVLERHAATGEVVEPRDPLFQVGNTDQMWLMLSVPAEDARWVRIGQKVTFRPDGSSPPVDGQVDWMSTAADPQTRTVQIRAILPNHDSRLLDGTFGQGRVILREEPRTIVVPADALQWDGSCHVVFVRDKNYFDQQAAKVFYPRPVRPGATTERRVEILAGVLPGEVVATRGSSVLRAELLKNNLGAG